MRYELGAFVAGVKILKTNGAQQLEKLKFFVRYACCHKTAWLSHKAMENRRRSNTKYCAACALKKKHDDKEAPHKQPYGIISPNWPKPKFIDEENSK